MISAPQLAGLLLLICGCLWALAGLVQVDRGLHLLVRQRWLPGAACCLAGGAIITLGVVVAGAWTLELLLAVWDGILHLESL